MKNTYKNKSIKIKPKNVMLNLPIIIEVNDYHELYTLETAFNELVAGKNKIKYEELSVETSGYVGIFYLNKKDTEFKRLYKETIASYSEGDENGDD